MAVLVLTTDRIVLRPFRLEDVDDVFNYASDREWSRFLNVPIPYTIQAAEEYVQKCVDADPSARCEWAIEIYGRVIGGIGIILWPPGQLVGCLGYALSREYWGRGLATEAAEAVIGWAFPAFDLAKVFASADSRNAASIRVMEKLGMVREGLLRSHRIANDGQRMDEVYYGLLRHEWETRRIEQG